MKQLIAGVQEFNARMKSGGSAQYEHLAEGQQPDTLFVACADSRVIPAFLSSAEPGALFTVRNVGNLIPSAAPSGHSSGDRSEASAIEYALDKLGVTNIVICGHSGCGAMGAVLAGSSSSLPVNLAHWLELAHAVTDPAQFPSTLGGGHTPQDVLSQRNVLLQLRALATYPNVGEALLASRLTLHGWWFDIRQTRVEAYLPEKGQFVAFDEVYGEKTHGES